MWGAAISVTVEVLDGLRPVRQIPVAGIVEEYMGTSAYMEIGALRRLVREGNTLSGAYLKVDAAHIDSLYRRLKATPVVAGVSLKRAAIESFEKTLAESFYIMIFFNLLFSGVIAFGVVYNAARVALSERSRELASLRVLGFTRGEISFILLGELAVVTIMAIPIGLVSGYLFAGALVTAFNTELYRFPLVHQRADVRLRGERRAGRGHAVGPRGPPPAGSPGSRGGVEDEGVASDVCFGTGEVARPQEDAEKVFTTELTEITETNTSHGLRGFTRIAPTNMAGRNTVGLKTRYASRVSHSSAGRTMQRPASQVR